MHCPSQPNEFAAANNPGCRSLTNSKIETGTALCGFIATFYVEFLHFLGNGSDCLHSESDHGVRPQLPPSLLTHCCIQLRCIIIHRRISTQAHSRTLCSDEHVHSVTDQFLCLLVTLVNRGRIIAARQGRSDRCTVVWSSQRQTCENHARLCRGKLRGNTSWNRFGTVSYLLNHGLTRMFIGCEQQCSYAPTRLRTDLAICVHHLTGAADPFGMGPTTGCYRCDQVLYQVSQCFSLLSLGFKLLTRMARLWMEHVVLSGCSIVNILSHDNIVFTTNTSRLNCSLELLSSSSLRPSALMVCSLAFSRYTSSAMLMSLVWCVVLSNAELHPVLHRTVSLLQDNWLSSTAAPSLDPRPRLTAPHRLTSTNTGTQR